MTDTHTTIQPIHNHTTELVHGFLVGHNYMEKLSESVFDTFEPDIKLFVELTILEDRNKGNSKIINKFRSWLYGMKLNFSLVH